MFYCGTMVKRLGQLIRSIRERVGLSQHDFADSIGETRNRVVKVELGLMRTNVEFLGKLRRVYKISLDRLFDKAQDD